MMMICVGDLWNNLQYGYLYHNCIMPYYYVHIMKRKSPEKSVCHHHCEMHIRKKVGECVIVDHVCVCVCVFSHTCTSNVNVLRCVIENVEEKASVGIYE